ncbi:MAG: ERF family protein [Candidatus Methanomethylophilaceae archaeon]|nr:ERF family protein [Candidatus Methanomethylophilaceae archaeon]
MTGTNVIERINEARRIVAETEFTKSGTVKGGQSYNFIPIAQILDAVRKAHAQAGVTVVFGSPEYDAEQFEKRYSYQKKGQYGETTWFAANGHIHATIYGSSVEDKIEMDVPFECQDNSDKLTNKIITNAERCLYRVLYAIDEGDATDPEAFNEPMQDVPKQGRKLIGQDDPFWSSKKQSPEEINFKKANECRKAIEEWIEEDPLQNSGNEIIGNYTGRFGQIGQWNAGTVLQCYKELRDAGVKLKEVAL